MATLRCMNPGTKKNRTEWLFVATMVGVCGILAVLQYRWTGDVARAEMTLLRDGLSRQAGELCKAFDAQLLKSRMALVPTATELDKSTREEVHAEKLRKWKHGKQPPIFKRMAVLVNSEEDPKLLQMDLDSESLVPMEWPDEWSEVQESFEGRQFGRPPPTIDGMGLIREFPVLEERRNPPRSSPRGPSGPDERTAGPGGPGGHREREWVILELDADYLRNTWMPALVSKHLNPKGNLKYDVVIRSKEPPEAVLFTTGPASLARGANPLSIEFNFFGTDPERFRNGPLNARWIMEVGHRAGSLESVVAGSRNRNLAVAAALNALILASGWMLLRTTRRAQRLAEEQMRFVANVTHELRTPLTVIRGAAHNLKRGIVRDPGGIEKYSKLIIDHAEALGSMVEQVLDFSGDRRSEAVREPLYLGQVLHDAVQTVKSDARFAACQIDLHLPANIPEITGDPAALRRAVQNLLENAAKHGGAGNPIGISVVVRERQVDVRVEDRGPGIPAAEIDEIFTPFFRGEFARSNQVRGSGLGLSLVRETAKAHGGDVTVRSEPGKGSTFTLSLPI
jgi:signal transduction histidine kinase